MAKNRKKITSSKKKKGHRGSSTTTTNSSKRSPPSSAAQPDVHEVISKADTALESSNIEQALQLYNYSAGVLRNELQNQTPQQQEEKESTILLLSKVLGKLAEAKVSVGDQHGAQQDFLEATNMLSGDGPTNSDNLVAIAQWKEARASLYLYLGQLSSSNDALEAFTRAIHDLRACLATLEKYLKNNHSDASSAPDEQYQSVREAFVETRRQLCGAYCSLSELYLTDLCFEADAEQNCEAALQAALTLESESKSDDPSPSPDAVQAMANLRLSQNRGLEAVSFMLEAYSRVKVGCEALADLVGLGTSDNDSSVMDDESEHVAKELKGQALDAANSLPGFEFRCQMSKLLLECNALLQDTPEDVTQDNTEDSSKRAEQRRFCVEAAIQVLGSLLAENDEVIEIWFLLGCAFSSTEPMNEESSRHYFETSLDMLEKVKKGMKLEVPSEELNAAITDINQKIKDVKQRLDGFMRGGGTDDNSKMEED